MYINFIEYYRRDIPISDEADGSCYSKNIGHHVLVVGIHGTDKDDQTLLTLKHLGEPILWWGKRGEGGGRGRERNIIYMTTITNVSSKYY
jgi:hypothetical protein